MGVPSRRSGARRCLRVFTCSLLVLGTGLSFTGCDQSLAGKTTVNVSQPIAFSHRVHANYFLSGKHRDEKFQMHTKPLALDQVPDELRQGKCSECHDMQDTQNCGCHVLFQDARLRARTELRPCVGCHRETWTGNAASIPGADVCGSCHGDKLLTDSAEEKRLRGYLQRGEGIRWVQLTTIDPHVLFSHKAHVRDAGVGCLRCHDEMRDMMSPPKTAAVFSMVGCMRCHTQNHASNDCLTCHK